ncbi:MAG: DUF4326 domain-containing protein [Prochlorococcaceae cyanobacterium]
MEISIGKARRGQLSGSLPGQAYVGRPSPLGNPFQPGRDGSRAEVIARYRLWLWARMQDPSSIQHRELEQLQGRALAGRLELLCWCSPLPCHAEVIRSALIWLAEQQR